MAIDMTAVVLPHDAIFDILSRLNLKSVCRFRCVSKGWRQIISGPVFAAAHKSRHSPLLVDAGSFGEEEQDGGRDMRLMDMDGNVVRVIRGVGGYGMMCNTSLDDLICVNGASCGGVNVVDPVTGKVLVSCPRIEVFPRATLRYYVDFGFGRAVPSGQYKLVRLVADQTWEVFTLGDGRGWRQMQPSRVKICYERGSPVVINGVMYVFQDQRIHNDDTLLSLDLDSTDKKAIRLTELNGALCIVVFSQVERPYPFTNIWILDNSDKRSWIKAYTITMKPYACRYMPLWVTGDDGKLILQCSFDKGQDAKGNDKGLSLVLQIYDPHTDTCTNIPGTPDDLANRIGLCTFCLDH